MRHRAAKSAPFGQLLGAAEKKRAPNALVASVRICRTLAWTMRGNRFQRIYELAVAQKRAKDRVVSYPWHQENAGVDTMAACQPARHPSKVERGSLKHNAKDGQNREPILDQVFIVVWQCPPTLCADSSRRRAISTKHIPNTLVYARDRNR